MCGPPAFLLVEYLGFSLSTHLIPFKIELDCKIGFLPPNANKGVGQGLNMVEWEGSWRFFFSNWN